MNPGRTISRMTVMDNVEALLETLGLNTTSEHYQETPRRVADMLIEFCSGPDPTEVLKNGFSREDPEAQSSSTAMIIQTGIPMRMLCPHHLAPAYGHAAIGYIPNKRVIGLSKLSRLVDACGTIGPITQEELTDHVADTLYKGIDALGVMVVASAAHTCMSVRGVRAVGAITSTSSIRGVFRDVDAARAEFLSIVAMNARGGP